jgi:16S rRNA processing protein RimM
VIPGDPWIAVGRVTRAHGVKGEVAVLPLTEVPARFEPGSRLFAGESARRPLTVAASRTHHHRSLVRFEEVADREVAEALSGTYLFVPAADAPPLPEGAYWPHQLVGCEVVTASGRSLGAVREVLHTGANDVWVADGPEGEVLIPALHEVVRTVDLDARRIVVAEIPGLTVPEDRP